MVERRGEDSEAAMVGGGRGLPPMAAEAVLGSTKEMREQSRACRRGEMFQCRLVAPVNRSPHGWKLS